MVQGQIVGCAAASDCAKIEVPPWQEVP